MLVVVQATNNQLSKFSFRLLKFLHRVILYYNNFIHVMSTLNKFDLMLNVRFNVDLKYI